MSHPNRSVFRRLVALSGVVGLAAGCLDRPVDPATPHTTNIFVDAVTQSFVDKIDLLFMIDNSRSMADKQLILERAVPVLVQRLVTPRCLDAQGNGVGTADANGLCATGEPEFAPIKDIHIGIITSSLGNHGGAQCTPTPTDAAEGLTPDDRGELLPKVRAAGTLTSWQDSGFLAWDPGQDKNQPPGEANLGTLVSSFGNQVRAAGELGCGYESSLEAWYRFLVDPEPPVSVGVVDNHSAKGAVNTALLDQRRAFLRPDSLLAIVMLTDENDCSINDDGQGFYVTNTSAGMPRASSACAGDPSDRCCYTCAADAPEGCPAKETDAECAQGAYLPLSEDNSNLRCFDHRRRFGLDFLYPVERYVDGLTKHTVKNRAGMNVPNPIFAAPPGGFPRPDTQVILAGIVGVPWQDIATEDSRQGTSLTYLDSAALKAQGRWDLILGNPRANDPPDDPHMRESVQPRSGMNPLLGIPIAPPTSVNPEENPINGHEQNVSIVQNQPVENDLQYACTFRLPMPRDCAMEAANSCDCNLEDQANNRPLCDYPNQGADGIQHHAKAYPGIRHLEVLKGVEDNGIVASICAKNTAAAAGLQPETDPSYGYNPAVASIINEIGKRVGGQCLPRALTPETDPDSDKFGQVPCTVVEALQTNGGACTCDATKGRTPVESADIRRSVREELVAHKDCGGDTNVDCDSLCLCGIDQLEGTELAACQAGSKDPNIYGYCYVDEDQGIGDPALVAKCKPTQRRLLRWVGEGLPANGSTMMMACFGATL